MNIYCHRENGNTWSEESRCCYLVNYVEERSSRPLQSLNKGRKNGKVKRRGDKIKFIDLRFERRKVVGFGKGRRQYLP